MDGLQQILNDLNQDYEHLLEVDDKINSFRILNIFTVLSVIAMLTRQIWIVPAIVMALITEVIRRYAMYCRAKVIEEHLDLKIILNDMMARFRDDDYSFLRRDTSKLDYALDVYDNGFLKFTFWGKTLVVFQWLTYILSGVVVTLMCLRGTTYLYELVTYWIN